MSFQSHSDVPLNADPSGRFVPWIVALMVYLATLSLMVALSISALINRWDSGVSARLTVEIPASNLFNPAADYERTQVRGKIVQALLRTPGIGSVRTLPRQEILSTLKPWLGKNNDLSQLPMPTLIDVEVVDHSYLNYDMLQKNLQKILPGVIVEDHMGWQQGVLDLAHSAQLIGFLIVAMIILAAISTIAFTSQTSLIIHRNIIEILYLVGATDAYIAQQFQRQALRVGMKGGMAGFGLSAFTFLILKFLSRHLDTTLLDEVVSTGMTWGIALLVPLCVTAFMMLSARFSVRLSLRYVI